ncbi:hypothetical protein CVO77_02225 [Sphingopyxis lindanitolerans]|uniref:Uncharacterized protein n=1 Tax=Sphingopyxis lindanitolerans TaxID=2054227 RepID=A0A2S8B502_9SPHN|nr:hypothetical protein CVO77_02225 [Sphingopyxis lindanitolerans]
MIVARILLWLTAGVLTVLVGASSAVIASQVKYPSRSVIIGVGPMGQAKANLAFASYAARQKQDVKAVISPRERKLASVAYRSEPLSSAALGILIASMDRAEGARRQALLDLGGKLTRRSSLITSASIEAAALRGDEPSFFLWMSRAILTNESLRSLYLKAMAQATARPGAATTLAPFIGPKPSWSDRYWNAVVSVPASLENAAKLRVLVAGAPWRQTEISDADRILARRLADYGHFDALQQMVAALDRTPSSRLAEGAVFNGDFSRPSALPPIDWALASSGNLGATIDPEHKLLAISAIAGARGYAARRLVELAPGAYEMEWDIVGDAALEKNVLTARVACAETGSNPDTAQVINLGVGHQRASLTIASDTCRWYWLSVNVNVPDMSAGIDAQFRRLNLRRID